MFAFVHIILATILLCSVVVFPIKIITSDSVNTEILDKNEKTSYATYNSCGGHIKAKCDERIIVEYKADDEYDNNEFCVWVIRSEECLGQLLTKTKSGFEVGYDYIQVSSFGHIPNIGDNPHNSEKMGSTTGIEQVGGLTYVNFLIFTTDNSNTGTGFRIEIVGYNPQTRPRWSDDFISTSSSGTTSLIPYPSYMFQTFLIQPQQTSVPSIRLDIEYYTIQQDRLAVFTMERNGQLINFRPQSKDLRGRGNATFEATYYTNFVVIFYSIMTNIPDDAGVTLSWTPSEKATTENSISRF